VGSEMCIRDRTSAFIVPIQSGARVGTLRSATEKAFATSLLRFTRPICRLTYACECAARASDATGQLPPEPDAYRMRGGKLPRRPPHVDARDVGVCKVCAGSVWEVTAGKAVHVQPSLESLAYWLDSWEGTIVFTGDTSPCPSVIDLARGADTLVCMCVEANGLRRSGGKVFTCALCGSSYTNPLWSTRRLIVCPPVNMRCTRSSSLLMSVRFGSAIDSNRDGSGRMISRASVAAQPCSPFPKPGYWSSHHWVWDGGGIPARG